MLHVKVLGAGSAGFLWGSSTRDSDGDKKGKLASGISYQNALHTGTQSTTTISYYHKHLSSLDMLFAASLELVPALCNATVPPQQHCNRVQVNGWTILVVPLIVIHAPVMKGRLISVEVVDDSSHLAFSLASRSRCTARRSLDRSMPDSFLNSNTR